MASTTLLPRPTIINIAGFNVSAFPGACAGENQDRDEGQVSYPIKDCHDG
jgi:hypothetical protein